MIIWNSNKAYFDGLSVVNIRQLLRAQKQFIEYCARDRRIEECWIWGNDEGNPDNKCLRLTSNFLRAFLSEECWKNWRPALTNLSRLGAIRVGLTQAAADWNPKILRRNRPAENAIRTCVQLDYEGRATGTQSRRFSGTSTASSSRGQSKEAAARAK